MTPDHDQLTYRPVDEWLDLTLVELEEAYALIPTQRQQHYREILGREAAKAHAVTDAEELQVAQALLARYQQDGLVPVGVRWAKPPQRVQTAARQGDPLTAPEEEYRPTSTWLPTPVLFLLAGVGLFICLLLIALLFSRGGEPEPTPVNPYASPTLRQTITPTPIALEQQDTIIKDGDTDQSRALAYPVGLQIYPPNEQQPRVFVVQRRAVEYAEWDYDPNPDTASYVLGMSVRRVVGIPWSTENEALFERLQEGAIFHLILNTGAVIEYRFERKTQLRRSDTAVFRQVAPALVLVLIGELDEEGVPTATRWLVLGRYEAEQELTRTGFLSTETEVELPPPTPTPYSPTPTPMPARDLLQVDVVAVGVSPDGYLVTQLRFYNEATEPITIYPDDIQLAFGEPTDTVHIWYSAIGLKPMTLLPDQFLDLSLYWKWINQIHASLQVLGYFFNLTLNVK